MEPTGLLFRISELGPIDLDRVLRRGEWLGPLDDGVAQRAALVESLRIFLDARVGVPDVGVPNVEDAVKSGAPDAVRQGEFLAADSPRHRSRRFRGRSTRNPTKWSRARSVKKAGAESSSTAPTASR